MRNPLVGVKLFKAICGDTTEIYDEESYPQVYRAMKRKAIREGEAIYWMDGSRTSWVDEVVMDLSEGLAESKRYTWNKAGKVKILRSEVNSTGTTSDGTFRILSTTTRTIWRDYDYISK